jgi:hypothetical protein
MAVIYCPLRRKEGTVEERATYPNGWPILPALCIAEQSKVDSECAYINCPHFGNVLSEGLQGGHNRKTHIKTR